MEIKKTASNHYQITAADLCAEVTYGDKDPEVAAFAVLTDYDATHIVLVDGNFHKTYANLTSAKLGAAALNNNRSK